MPKIDPETQQPMSDAPDGPAGLRGGMKEGDPELADATETGGSGPGHPATSSPEDGSTQLPAEKGSDT